MACPENIIRTIALCLKEKPCEVEIRYDEPMAVHTTFKAGGPADCWIKPSGESFPAFAAALFMHAQQAHIPVFTLGGGANILVADSGIRGIVLDTGGWAGKTAQQRQEGALELRAGTGLDDAAAIAAEAGLSGLEFLAGMPGSIGGAVYMNARCYGQEIADVLTETEIINFSGSKPEQVRLPAEKAAFGYKHSPFQKSRAFILSAALQLNADDPQKIRARMDANRADRSAKGHYRYPSAGSVFKNNHSFGKPTGQIIDELGLCGLHKGGAQIAPWHGNFIINTGNAAAADIRALIDEAAAQVKSAAGFDLEPEILFVGDF